MKHGKLLGVGSALLIMSALIACSESPSGPTALSQDGPMLTHGTRGNQNGEYPTTATIKFGSGNFAVPLSLQLGQTGFGSQYEFTMRNRNRLSPRTVTIAAGGSVTFTIGPLQQVAIYAPGTRASDIKENIKSDSTLLEDLTTPVEISDFVINDPTNRVALSPAMTAERTEWTTPTGTFDTPGRYLIISTAALDFLQGEMIGWIIVR